MAAEHKGVGVLDTDAHFHRHEGPHPGAVKHAGLAHHPVLREAVLAQDFVSKKRHRVERIGDNDDDGVWRGRGDVVGHVGDDLLVDTDQIFAGHARLASHPGGDNDDVAVLDVGVVGGAGHFGVVAQHRAGFGQVEGLALGHVLSGRDVEQDDIAKLAFSKPVGGGGADKSGADDGDLVSHNGDLRMGGIVVMILPGRGG